MKNNQKLTVAFIAVLSFVGSYGADAGTVTGTIKFAGAAPAMAPLKLNKECEAKQAGKKPTSETLVLGPGSTMGNVYVYVKSGLPSQKWPVPKEAAVLDQRGCVYVPHTIAIQAGQTLDILNSDGITHNVNAKCMKNPKFNAGMPGARTKMSKTFDKPEICTFKCDVHPWMQANLAISEHPFFAVTKDDGKYQIANLPAGSYEIEAWHAKLGTKVAKVSVGASDSQTIDFSFDKPAAPIN